MPDMIVCHAGVIPYRQAVRLQQRLQQQRIAGETDDIMLLLEHPPVYTIGRRGDPRHLLRRDGDVELVLTSRGGDITYHGPGQIVGYLIVDLKELYLDLKRFFHNVEAGIIDALATLGLSACHDPRNRGVWIGTDKIAAIGIQVRRWVTMHGFALNVATDMEAFDDIIPCGLSDRGVTSLRHLGCKASMETVSDALGSGITGRLGRRPRHASLDELDHKFVAEHPER
jgi:lipoyl(octanoyl) transferase